MKLSLKDLFVIITALSVIAGASLGLYLDYTSRIDSSQSNRIGTVSFKKKTAERKYGDQLIWKDVASETPVYNNDSIRTADGSAAVVHLNDGTKIDLEENTLVMLAMSDKGANIDLAGGSIFAKTSDAVKTGKSVNIRSGGTSVTVSKGALNLTRTAEKSIAVSVSSGAAVVTGASAAPVNVGVNQTATVSAVKAEVKNNSYTLINPSPNEYFLQTPQDKKGILFSWKNESYSVSTLVVSSDRTFKKIALNKNLASNNREQFAAGDYYWMVSGADGSRSEIRKFTVLEDASIIPLSPKDGATLSSRAAQLSVSLSWSESKIASFYEIEYSKDRAFRTGTVRLTSATASFTADGLSEGHYFWRVRPMYGISTALPPIKESEFVIVRLTELPVPQTISPPNNTERSEQSVSEGKLSFSWNTSAEFISYQFELSRDLLFTSILKKQNVTSNYFPLITPLKEGVYYWRVTGIASDGAVSKPSAIIKLSIVKPRAPVELTATPDAEGSYVFKWKDPDGVGLYRVDICADASNKKVIRSEESSSVNITISKLQQGTYFWWVSSIDGNGVVVAQSATAKIFISEKIESPILVSPLGNVSLNIAKMKTIDFTWKPVKGATLYELEIYQYSYAIEKQMFRAETIVPSYAMTQFSSLENGKFYWQIIAIKKTEGSVVSKSVPAKGYFNIPAGPDIKAPKLENIKVYIDE